MDHQTSQPGTPSISRRKLLGIGLLGGCAVATGGIVLWAQKKPTTSKKSPTGPKSRTVILITLDTTRADHLGCYRYGRDTSPNIDRLADDALVFDRAIAPGTWTLPSHASLFTGKFVSSHGAQYDPDGDMQLIKALEKKDKSWDVYRAKTISATEITLADVLRQAGFVTGAVVAGPWLKRIFGLDKGFDHYDDGYISELNGRLADSVTDHAIQFLKKTNGQSRFLFLNYFDPHSPLQPPAKYARQFVPGGLPTGGWALSREQKIGLYDAEINFMDHHIGRLLDWLRNTNEYEDALIVVTADHGSLTGEHGEWGHGATPYQEVVHIPMLVKEQGASRIRNRSNDWVQLTDVLPMILQRLDVATPPNIQGNLPSQIQHPILIESRTLPTVGTKGHWMAVINDDKKYVWNSKGNHMMFDLAEDPDENNNLFPANMQEIGAAFDELTQYLASLPQPGSSGLDRNVDQQTLDALKNLGYVK
ncbi:MAG: sulfatase [Pirellulales bacterium]